VLIKSDMPRCDCLARIVRSGAEAKAKNVRMSRQRPPKRITVQDNPNCSDNVEIEITGRLNALLGEQAYPNGVGRIGDSVGSLPRKTRSCIDRSAFGVAVLR